MNELITPHCIGWAQIKRKEQSRKRAKVFSFGLVIGLGLAILLIKSSV